MGWFTVSNLVSEKKLRVIILCLFSCDNLYYIYLAYLTILYFMYIALTYPEHSLVKCTRELLYRVRQKRGCLTGVL